MALPKSRPTVSVTVADLEAFVSPAERRYFVVSLVASFVLYSALILAAIMAPQVGVSLAVYAVVLPLAALLLHGVMLGRVRGNGIKVSAWQLPDVYRVARSHASKLGLAKLPEIYVVQSGGVLNAFATRFLRRDFVVLYSDVLEVALERGEAAVGFVVAHELAHVARGHLKNRWLLWPARLVPYLYQAYSRACEYSCDRLAAFCQPDGAIPGLLLLAAGKQLYRHVDWQQYALQAASERDMWTKRAELLSSHPHLTKRVAALVAAGVPTPERAPMPADFKLRATQSMAAVGA